MNGLNLDLIPNYGPAGAPHAPAGLSFPERETLELAAAGAAKVLGLEHGVTKALAKASITRAPADLWLAKMAIKTLRRDQREAIAEVGED